MKQIQDEEMEKQRIQQELAALTQRLSRVNESLARKVGCQHVKPACTYVVRHMDLQLLSTVTVLCTPGTYN
jgi:hypothetical protein